MLGIELWTPEKPFQLLHTVDAGAQDRLLHSGQGLLDGFGGSVKDFPEEETQGAHRDDQGTNGQLLDTQQVQEVVLDLVIGDLVGRTVVELG